MCGAKLERGLTTRILDRLELGAAPLPSRDGLASLYRAWCRHVPFDNSLKRIHVAANDKGLLPGSDPVQFFDAWLRWGTGGTCWAGNGALHSLLCTLGFDAERGLATMMVAPDLPPNHGTVIVRVDGGCHLVDASILHSEPLRLDEDAETAVEHPAWGVRCAKRDGKWHVLWKALHRPDGFECRLDSIGAAAEDFAGLHEATRGWSPFNYQANVRIIRGGRVIGLAFGARVEIAANGSLSVAPVNDAERRRVLVEEVGMHPEHVERIPDDTPTPPPPGHQEP